MEDVIRVLVVDDHTVVRKGIAALLSSQRYGIEVVGEASDGIEAIREARKLRPDVILMDLIMPSKGGLEAIIEIRKENSMACIIVLSSFDNDSQISAALQAGAMGYLLKDSTPEELVYAIRNVRKGNITLTRPLAERLADQATLGDSQDGGLAILTNRELDVLRGIAQGKTNREIAQTLVLSPTTVRTHVSNMLHKLSLDNRTQAALYAKEVGIFDSGSNNSK